MILSDREIRAAIKQRHMVIDPQPAEEQYNTSALDLRLGDELLELRSLEELQQDEPAGVERPLVIDLAKVRMAGLLQTYAKPFARGSDGSFVLPPVNSRSASPMNGSSFRVNPRLRRASKAAVRWLALAWRST
jgi:hypothetical protein